MMGKVLAFILGAMWGVLVGRSQALIEAEQDAIQKPEPGSFLDDPLVDPYPNSVRAYDPQGRMSPSVPIPEWKDPTLLGEHDPITERRPRFLR